MGDEYREALQFMENINLVLLSIEAPGADTSSGEKLQGLEQSFLESRRTVCADAADAVFSRAVLPNSIAPTHIAPCEIRSLVSDTPNFLEAIPPLLEKLRVWQMLPRVKVFALNYYILLCFVFKLRSFPHFLVLWYCGSYTEESALRLPMNG